MLTRISLRTMLSLVLGVMASVCAVNAVAAGDPYTGGSGSSSSSRYVPSAPVVPLDPQAAAARAEARAAADRADREEERKARQIERAEQRKAKEIENAKREAALAEERRIADAKRRAEEPKTLAKLQSAMRAEVESSSKTHLVDQPNSIADSKRRDDKIISTAQRELKVQERRSDFAQQNLKAILQPEKAGPEMFFKDMEKWSKDNTRLGDFERKVNSEADANDLSKMIIKQSKSPASQKSIPDSVDDFIKKVYSGEPPGK